MKLRTWWNNLTQIPGTDTPHGAQPQEPMPDGDIGRTVRMGSFALLGTLAAFILFAVFAPIDSGVPTQGMVTIDTKRKTIQHLTGGLVEKVLIREGQPVQAGELLIKLNESQARAEYESARQRYLSLRTTEDRLLAEQAGKEHIDFHPDVLADKDDPTLAAHLQTQQQMLTSRRLALRSETGAINEALQAQQEAAKGYSAQLESRKQQRQFIIQERDGLRELVKEGYAPRNKLWEIERMASETEAIISDLTANLARARRGAAEMAMRKTQREQEFRKEVDSALADVQREISADEERLKATREALERTEIRAPVAGSVTGIAQQTVGGVIAPGSRIMDIVPSDEILMLEAQIPPHLRDRLKIGQSADVRFSNFSNTPQLVIEGQLVSISADLLTDPISGGGYYLARIRITQDGQKSLGNHVLQPGMPAEIVIKTGERSLFSYLLNPLVRRISQSMKED